MERALGEMASLLKLFLLNFSQLSAAGSRTILLFISFLEDGW